MGVGGRGSAGTVKFPLYEGIGICYTDYYYNTSFLICHGIFTIDNKLVRCYFCDTFYDMDYIINEVPNAID